jgi:DNA integrity scanning protein DisA with diadenylate cyclase activity
MRKGFDRLVAKLQKTNLKVRVKMEINEVIVECGFNYPDEVAMQIFEIADELSMEVTVCAEQHGGKILDSITINGGPKRF